MQQAYKVGKYAFVSDYARLDIIYQQGGFYLDTDIELYRSLDRFTRYKAVVSFMEYGEITTGLGFGSIPFSDEYMIYEIFMGKSSLSILTEPTILTNVRFILIIILEKENQNK